MLNKIKKSNQGFTIIEVLIVLAIAGLILLIVFLAVPALQRNSRNTTKKNDVSKVLAAANEWVSNNSGKKITTGDSATANTAAESILKSSGVSSTDVKITVVDAAVTAVPGRDEIVIVTNVQCSGSGVKTAPLSGTGAFDVAAINSMVSTAASRAYGAVYMIESNGSNFTSQCQGS